MISFTPPATLLPEKAGPVSTRPGGSQGRSGHFGKRMRHCTYKRNIVERSSNHCCRRKAIDITHSECVSVVLVI